MKKSAVVFLITLCIVIAGLLTVSCNSAVKEEFGTVVLDFGGGGTRAVGADGLPLLNDSRILIKGEGSLSGPFSKEFSSAQGVLLSFPIGDEVTLRVSILTPSARWSSAPQSFTVEAGTNAVSVKLSKKISGLNNLLFTQTKSGTSAHVYDLTLHMDGKTITVPESTRSEHIFSRDSKGRVYVRYNETGNDKKLIRYTSEGDSPAVITVPASVDLSAFINDFTKGEFYVVSGQGAVYKIEGSSVGSYPLTTLTDFKGSAAIDNNRVVWIPRAVSTVPGTSVIKIYAKDLTSTASPEDTSIDDHIKIHGCRKFNITDIFTRGGYVYLLFNALNSEPHSTEPKLYSLGGVVRYNINNLTEAPVKIGFDNHPDFENGVLEDYDYSENFYGAVKVIGFDEENLYIADDGFDAAYTDDYPRIVKNRNRIGVLNMKTNALSFTDAYPAKWNKEWSEWKGTKTIVWEKANEHAPLNYYQLENAGSPLPSTSLAPGMTDMFTYDQAGSLYIYKTVDKIRKFKLKDDGSYDTTSEDLLMGLSANESMIGFAVDLSTKSLYYAVYDSSTPASYNVKKMTWTNNFTSASSVPGYTISIPASSGTVLALAANKDGLFFAVKKTTAHANEVDKKYTIEVYKYSHDNASVAEKTIPIVSAKPLYQAIQGTDPDNNNHKKYVDETVTALHIKNGVLYALTTERTVRRHGDGGYYGPSFSYITGKLLQIGKDTSSFDEISAGRSVKQLYGYDIKDITPETSGDFAPVRFIAIKPKKLVIASTGYVFLKSDADIYPNSPSSPDALPGVSTYKRKIYEFDLEAAAMPAGTAQDTTIFYKAFGECEYSW